MLKLIVSDLDGTFLNNIGSFNKSLFNEVYGEMQEKNITFAACTGKQCERVEELFGDSGQGIWILGDSATRIKKDGILIEEFILDRNMALQLIENIEGYNSELIIIACTSDAAFVKNSISDEYFDIVRNSYTELKMINNFHEINSNFIKITVYDPFKKSLVLRNYLQKSFKDQAYIVASEPSWLDITASGTHKGETVKKLQQILEVTKDETMSFGDGENDIELMDIAKYSFAMRNACENTKEAAHFITKSNEEDGVLLTIRKMMDLFR